MMVIMIVIIIMVITLNDDDDDDGNCVTEQTSDRHDASVQDDADGDGSQDSSGGDRTGQDEDSSGLVGSVTHVCSD